MVIDPHLTSVPSSSGKAKPSAEPSLPDSDPPQEVGADKSVTQHMGNAAFGTASSFSLMEQVKSLAKVARKSRAVRIIPGLNLAVVALESYNAAKKLKEGDPVVAVTSAGNAAGCLGTFLDTTGKATLLTGKFSAMARFLHMGAAFSILGGALGLVAGKVEIERGLKIKRAGGTGRTLTMGMLDVTSGLTSMSGAVLVASGVGGPLGIGLLIASGLCDIAGIAADYLGKKSDMHAETQGSTPPAG
jgi:hypothetical protein